MTLTPFHAAAFAFLAAGLALAAHQGLQAFDAVAPWSWVGWSHIHFVTVGALTQLLFGMLPQLAARRLGLPPPGSGSVWASFAALNGGFLAAWWGRVVGPLALYDAGLAVVWLSALALLASLLRLALRAGWPAARDPTVVLYLVSPAVFLVGLTLAFGLYSRTFALEVPGGWWGLREGHVHANAWGFLGLGAIGLLFDAFPRIVGAPLQSPRRRAWSSALLAAGVWPLAIGPVLGMGRTVTGAGLVLFVVGYVLYVSNLVSTYRCGTGSGFARWVLAAQAWVLAPAGLAPFVLFGVPLGIPEPSMETGALHFFFVGWALPFALAALALDVRNLPSPGRRKPAPDDPGGPVPYTAIPASMMKGWMVPSWNVAVLGVGLAFFYQEARWSPPVLAVGFTVIVVLWGHHLARIAGERRRFTASLRSAPSPASGRPAVRR